MRAASALDGIIVMDKPAGWTSHDVVAKARGITGQRRIGHTGTLDPMATGVLVLCLGQATRLVEYMTAHDKRYEGEIVLGATTTTDDAEGEILLRRPVPPVVEAQLRELERRFRGYLSQRPPAYSAIKVDGIRAYARARAGEERQLPERPITIHEIALAPLSPGRLRVAVHCGPGTYVRSLARDIGEALGCGAHLGSLRRTHVGRFSLTGATTLNAIAAHVENGTLEEVLLQPDEGIAEFDAAIVDHPRAAKLRFGAVVAGLVPAARATLPARIYDTAGEFVGVGSVAENGEIRGVKVLNLAKPVTFS
ncbi:MAG: tRNA pseudouridine(55) synthase TruB [Anaerolinea sp.]|nr:tRNA pseudouridine(55) synthase TruB [Anaerolinea sp.]